MTAKELGKWIMNHFQGLIETEAFRETSFFYNPDRSLLKGIYFTTIKESDGPNDKSSNLDREDVYRLSIGVGKNEYKKLFGDIPKRPEKGCIIDSNFDFQTLNILMPHPIYAWLGWVCINSPNYENLPILQNLLIISYQNAIQKFAKKKPKS